MEVIFGLLTALLVLGVAFKRGVDDARNSPAEPIVRELLQLGADVAYHDPYVPRFVSAGPPPFSLLSAPLDLANLAEWDAVLIVTGHPGLDYAAIVQGARCVIDAPNVTAGVAGAERVWRIGAPPPRTDTARRGVSPR